MSRGKGQDKTKPKRAKEAIQKMKDWCKTPEGKKFRKSLIKKVSGKNNHRYQAFKLVEKTVKGEIKEYTFDCPSSPMKQCLNETGINLNRICSLKKGEEWVITVVNCKTKHKFAKGSIITLIKIDPK